MMTLIRCGQLFTGTGNDPLPQTDILVEDGRIGEVSAGIEAPDAEMIDLSSYFVMPGLIDAHTHLSVDPSRGDQLGQMRQPPGQQALRVPGHLAKDLAAGTTTLRIMGEEDWLDVYTRQAIREGSLAGPNLLIATRGLAASNGHGRAKSAFDGTDEVRHGARENLAHGADFLKLFATGGVASGTGLESAMYSFDEMRVAVEEAERKGTYVAAHAHGGPGLRMAAEAGVRTIEHAALASEADVEAMLRQNCWVIGTFTILFHPDGIERGDASNPAILEKLVAAREKAAESMARIFASGLPFALGTDSMHGHMPYEVQTAIRLGLSPKQALLAATKGGARALRIDDRTGTIEAGKDADIIALDGDPLVDPSALDRIVFVMKGGKSLALWPPLRVREGEITRSSPSLHPRTAEELGTGVMGRTL
jgi:imidazolonepropionase-like amidohydrolase